MTTKTTIAPSKPELKRPSLYKVLIIDDEVSTYQCVIDILINHFNKSEDEAYDLAFIVDNRGVGLVGTYPKDIAETKIALAKSELKIVGFTLRIDLLSSI